MVRQATTSLSRPKTGETLSRSGHAICARSPSKTSSSSSTIIPDSPKPQGQTRQGEPQGRPHNTKGEARTEEAEAPPDRKRKTDRQTDGGGQGQTGTRGREEESPNRGPTSREGQGGKQGKNADRHLLVTSLPSLKPGHSTGVRGRPHNR